MENKQFPKEIADCIGWVEKNVMVDPARSNEYLTRLESYARDTHSDELTAFCLFYRGYQSYAESRLQDSMDFLSQSLNCLIDVENWYQAAKAYNAMGNIADFLGDSSLAIDCYLKGLDLCREYGLVLAEHDISSNLANVYITLNDYEAAVKLLKYCEELIVRTEATGPLVSETVVKANIAMCYIQMEEYDQAEKYMEQMRHLMAISETPLDVVSVGILETKLFHARGEIEKRDAAIGKVQEMKLTGTNVFDALNELCHHALLLLELDRVDEFLFLVERIESLAGGPTVEKHMMELRLSYYEKIGDEASCAALAMKYYKLARMREEERNRIVCSNIATRIRLNEEENRRKEVEKANLLLKQKSERDALTGMNNRYKLNELAETAFQRAYHDGLPLTFEILDIDCYKEYNDHYGHQAGDECLIRIADAIRSLEKYEGVHTARYGGDEFVIIYENYSKQEVEKMAEELQEKIRGLNIEHKYSKVSDRVTITQGLFHKIPSGGNKTWDFLSGADMTLYGVKQRSKDNFYVATSFEEAGAYSQGI